MAQLITCCMCCMNIQESIHPNTKIFHKSQAANDVIDIYWEPNQGLISGSSRHGHLHFMEKVAIDAVESEACPPRRVWLPRIYTQCNNMHMCLQHVVYAYLQVCVKIRSRVYILSCTYQIKSYMLLEIDGSFTSKLLQLDICLPKKRYISSDQCLALASDSMAANCPGPSGAIPWILTSKRPTFVHSPSLVESESIASLSDGLRMFEVSLLFVLLPSAISHPRDPPRDVTNIELMPYFGGL